MASPALIVCDSDALIQFLVTKEIRPLQILQSTYGIQPTVVPEVELELRSNRRFAQRISRDLRKAFDSHLLQILNADIVAPLYGGPPAGLIATTAALSNISTLGRNYERYIDRGEAYTHAAAVTLGVPSLSNDFSALRALVTAGLPVPSTVLRAFDMLCLGYQSGQLSERDCDAFRSALLGESEHVPKCFAHKSFLSGLQLFCPRIVDSGRPAIGSNSCPPAAFASVVHL